MRILMLAVAMAALAAPALAQTPEEKAQKVTRAPKLLTGPDTAVVQEAAKTVKAGGECNAVYTIGLDGKAKDIKPNCNPPEYDEWVIKSMAAMTFTVELFMGEQFETEGMKQPFKFGAGPGTSMAAAPAAAKIVEPVMDPKSQQALGQAITRAINQVDKPGACQVEFTVGVDGKTKNITPNCNPDVYNKRIQDAIEKAKYSPATKDGQPVEHTLTMPLNLSKPN